MDRKQKGFTLIEILVVVTIIGVLAGLVVVLIPKGQFEAKKTECMNNVRNLCALLTTGKDIPTKYGGANLMLYLVKHGDLPGEENLKLLFCPADKIDTWDGTGGKKAYGDSLDIKVNGEHDHLTSYAGRDQTNKKCRTGGTGEPVALVCDDSEDHHDAKGLVIGFTGGAVKFRHKFDDWEIDVKTSVQIGEGSGIEELECMRAD